MHRVPPQTAFVVVEDSGHFPRGWVFLLAGAGNNGDVGKLLQAVSQLEVQAEVAFEHELIAHADAPEHAAREVVVLAVVEERVAQVAVGIERAVRGQGAISEGGIERHGVVVAVVFAGKPAQAVAHAHRHVGTNVVERIDGERVPTELALGVVVVAVDLLGEAEVVAVVQLHMEPGVVLCNCSGGQRTCPQNEE